jgi:ACR3 family arsenite efflux pump ArsB
MNHIPTLDDYVVTNEGHWKIDFYFYFFYYHPMCQLGINSLPTMRSKCSLILGMLTNFGINPILFFTLNPICLKVFLLPTCLQKESHLTTSSLSFPYLSKNPRVDSVQASIFPYKQFN